MGIVSFIHKKMKVFKFYRGIVLLLKIRKENGFLKYTLINEYRTGKY